MLATLELLARKAAQPELTPSQRISEGLQAMPADRRKIVADEINALLMQPQWVGKDEEALARVANHPVFHQQPRRLSVHLVSMPVSEPFNIPIIKTHFLERTTWAGDRSRRLVKRYLNHENDIMPQATKAMVVDALVRHMGDEHAQAVREQIHTIRVAKMNATDQDALGRLQDVQMRTGVISRSTYMAEQVIIGTVASIGLLSGVPAIALGVLAERSAENATIFSASAVELVQKIGIGLLAGGLLIAGIGIGLFKYLHNVNQYRKMLKLVNTYAKKTQAAIAFQAQGSVQTA